MMAQPLTTVTGVPVDKTTVRRQISHPHFNKFKEAKAEIIIVYGDIFNYIEDCYRFTDEQTKEERFSKLLSPGMHDEVKVCLLKTRNIRDILSRNQMKCAFFGRTSNGKSTVINAMLSSKLLPAGIGHTTSCFLLIEGTDKNSGYLIMDSPNSNPIQNGDNAPSDTSEVHSIESVSQLAHSLSAVKLSSNSLLRIYWPSAHCRLLREDVVFLDSPGINVDPDMDKWIDTHCLDADVFILVANAESTLMQAEKDFFHKVSQRLSKPNIFIINNRWDASANEMEYVSEVRAQHLNRCVAFLVDELKVYSTSEAEEHVFFVSALEALTIRTKTTVGNHIDQSAPPGSAPIVISPGVYLAEGWQTRLLEFTNFESIFEKTLSESAIRTKFAAHCEEGKVIANRFRTIMEKVYEVSVEEKDAAIRCRQLSEISLGEVRSRLNRTSHQLEELIQTVLGRVEARVSSALNAEIRRLGELVDLYDRPFHPDPALLHLYKSELNTHVEKELGRKITEACSHDIKNEVARTELLMIDKHASIVTDELWRHRILDLIKPTSFSPEFYVDCRNLCADFHEDIQFRFSLGLGTLFQKLTSPKYSQRRNPWLLPGLTQTQSASSAMIASTAGGPLMSMDLFPSLLSRNTLGAVIILGLVLRAAGWRVLGLASGIYGGLYAYERLSWTNRAKEAAFKRQYVEFASHKLRLIVDLTTTNARHQVKRELQLTNTKLTYEIEACALSLSDEVKQLDSDITRLDEINSDARKLKNRAAYIYDCLEKFYQDFIA